MDLGRFRRVVQRIRHAPGLERLEPLWSVLRGPYRLLLQLGVRRGLTVQIGGVPIRLHPHFATMGWEKLEEASYREYLARLRPGMTVVDVGAHAGTYSILASRSVGAGGKVIAFEPDAGALEYLYPHLAWNGCLHNTVVRERCLSSGGGAASFYYMPAEASSRSGLVPVAGYVRRTVNTNSLDSEMAELGAVPHLIKIDVEGGEMEVLRGGESTLTRHRPTLLLSLHPEPLQRQGLSEQTVLDWLSERGYGHQVIGRDHEVHVLATPSQEGSVRDPGQLPEPGQ